MYEHRKHDITSVQKAALRRQAGNFLKRMREMAGLTQLELSERADLGYYTKVSQFETGRAIISPSDMPRYASVLGVPPDEFAKTLLRCYQPVVYQMIFGVPAVRPTEFERNVLSYRPSEPQSSPSEEPFPADAPIALLQAAEPAPNDVVEFLVDQMIDNERDEPETLGAPVDKPKKPRAPYRRTPRPPHRDTSIRYSKRKGKRT